MRYKKLISSIIFGIFLFLIIFQFIQLNSYAVNNDDIIINYIHRDFIISRNGIITIIDNYTVYNNGLEPVSSLYISIDDDYYSKLKYIEARNKYNDLLNLKKIPNTGIDFEQWILLLDNPLNPKNTLNFTIKMIFIDLISISTNKKVNIQFNKYPISPYFIRKCIETFYSPTDTTIKNPFTDTDTSTPTTSPVQENISAWSSEKIFFSMTFTSGTPMYGFVYMYRELDLNYLGFIQVKEKHTVKNLGPYDMDRLSQIKFALPSIVKNVRVYDNFSMLNYQTKSSQKYINITISLSPDRYELNIGESYSYYVDYILPIENYIVSTSGDLVKFIINPYFGNFECQIYQYILKIILPQGSSIININNELGCDIENYNGKPVIIYEQYNTIDYGSSNIEITYNQMGSYIYLIIHPLLISLIIGLIASGYVIIKRGIPYTTVTIERKAIVPSAILREFCQLYEQKMAVMTEIDKLENYFRKRKIRAREYKKLLKVAEQNISEIDKALDELKPKFRSAGGRYSEIVEKLEFLEAEKMTKKDSLNMLKAKYKRKLITPRAYNKLNEQMQKELDKIKSQMEKLVQELRDYLT